MRQPEFHMKKFMVLTSIFLYPTTNNKTYINFFAVSNKVNKINIWRHGIYSCKWGKNGNRKIKAKATKMTSIPNITIKWIMF